MPTEKNIANEAYERFVHATEKINVVKNGIEQNRKGEAQLSEIGSDPEKLAKRLARENMPISAALERINGVPNFQDIHILSKIFRIAESVGRITIRNRYGNTGYGTGFLIAPGIIITNNHVFPDAETAKYSQIQFKYELDDKGQTAEVQTFGFDPKKFFLTSTHAKIEGQANSGLDFTIVALSQKSKEGKNILDIPHCSLDENLGKIIEGENCVIIQHPKGDYKKIVLKDIRMLTLTDDFLIYESDTLPGSSGAVVLGLGTGEVVALHHSSIPRKNNQGQWLRKDGGVYVEGDPDESIDWIGNEGIRVRSLVKAIREAQLTDSMKKLRQTILKNIKEDHDEPLKQKTPNKPQAMKHSNESVVNQAINMLQANSDYGDGQLQYFEIELSPVIAMQEDWKENGTKLVKGLISSEPLFPLSTVPSQKAMHYLTLRSDENPWELAAKIEALPQVKTVTPDLPMETDLQYKTGATVSEKESEILGQIKTSSVMAKDDDFKTKWHGSPYLFGNTDDLKRRGWNRLAVGLCRSNAVDDSVEYADLSIIEVLDEILHEQFPEDEVAVKKAELLRKLANLKLVQLDTGYTDHLKVRGRYNFQCDEDFIDGDDARDEQHNGFLRFPGHGTRTSSIINGGDMSSMFSNDGNYGLLCDRDKKQLVDVIPYRIAQSVVLIGRGKNLVDAVNQAIHTNTDVLFMCMGSYPRPMLAEAAKAVYDNGVIWVCAAGNEVEMVIAPALYPGTIAVAAINPNQKPWRGSCYGDTVDVSAPGEDIYVPALGEKYNEIMVYGNGTSYATPHVASAAMLWKAKHHEALDLRYAYGWQTIEAFRYCLQKSAYKPEGWDEKNYGAGILNIVNLLKEPLPDPSVLKYAYTGFQHDEWDLGVREGVHYLWSVLLKKAKSAFESTDSEMVLTERGRIAISAMTGNTAASIFEADSTNAVVDTEKILKLYFESFK